MPARKVFDADASVEKKVRGFEPGDTVRQLPPVALEIRRLREELKVNTTCGASNVSFGLPNRNQVTGTFLSMAMASGMTSAIMSPLHPEVKAAIMDSSKP